MILDGKWELYESMPMDTTEFFQGFDNEALKEKVTGIQVSLFVAADGDTLLGLGIESLTLSSQEKEQLHRHFTNRYDLKELGLALVRQHQERTGTVTPEPLSRPEKKRHHGEER